MIMQHPSWMPQSSRSQAWLYCGQRLVAGNPRAYCKHGVLEDDAVSEGARLASVFHRDDIIGTTHCSTEFSSTVGTLANNANYSRVARCLSLKLASLLSGHCD